MSEFIVKTKETVEGVYRVTAASVEEAMSKFGDPQIDWETVEQIDYQVYSVEVMEVYEEPRSDR